MDIKFLFSRVLIAVPIVFVLTTILHAQPTRFIRLTSPVISMDPLFIPRGSITIVDWNTPQAAGNQPFPFAEININRLTCGRFLNPPFPPGDGFYAVYITTGFGDPERVLSFNTSCTLGVFSGDFFLPGPVGDRDRWFNEEITVEVYEEQYGVDGPLIPPVLVGRD